LPCGLETSTTKTTSPSETESTKNRQLRELNCNEKDYFSEGDRGHNPERQKGQRKGMIKWYC
jgi:hypothetical protein